MASIDARPNRESLRGSTCRLNDTRPELTDGGRRYPMKFVAKHPKWGHCTFEGQHAPRALIIVSPDGQKPPSQEGLGNLIAEAMFNR